MQRGLAFCVFLPGFCLGVSSCVSPVARPPNPSGLQGNWHLIGQSSGASLQSFDPFIALAMGLSGNTLYYSGVLQVPCSQGGESVAETVTGTAPLAADGTFQLSNAASSPHNILFSIQGQAPAQGSTAWQGAYSLTNAPAANCIFDVSGPYSATPYPPFQGTYAGKASGLTMQLEVAQGAPAIPGNSQSTPPFSLPLDGSIAVSGSSCFTSGTFANNPNSGVSGDSFSILAVMNDGSAALVNGWFTDQTEKSLQPVILQVLSGPCKGTFAPLTLSLTLQT